MLTKEELEKIREHLGSLAGWEDNHGYQNNSRFQEIVNSCYDLQNRIDKHISEAFPEEDLQAQVKELENWVMSHGVVIEE